MSSVGAPSAEGVPSWCVCVPARDEEDRLGGLLAALARQAVEGAIPVVVALNNTTDGSAKVVEAARRSFAGRLDVTLDIHRFEPALAHAGAARRRAMTLGRTRVGARGEAVLISTDADTRPPDDWVRTNLEAIARGADVVGGRLVLDEAETPRAEVASLCRAWDAYWERVRGIEDEIDPVAHDPSPRHGDHTGASLAITVSAYDAAGGVPLAPTGEDRALVAAAVAMGARLAHPAAVWTRVSPRATGRARGGMAEHMRDLERIADNDGDALMAPDLAHWRARALWRRRLREAAGDEAVARAEALLPPMPCDLRLDGAHVGCAQP